MLAVINALSDALVAGLAASNWPPLRDFPNGTTGRILIVDAHRLDQFMPPRVSMMPLRSKFGNRNNTRGPVKVANNSSGYDAESKAAIANKAIHTDEATFEVRCWGIASDDEEDPYGRDFDYTWALRDALIAAANETMSGCYLLEGGDWQVVSHGRRVGREFVFLLTIHFPVLGKVAPPTGTSGLPFAPSNVAPKVTDAMQLGTGESSPGCENP